VQSCGCVGGRALADLLIAESLRKKDLASSSLKNFFRKAESALNSIYPQLTFLADAMARAVSILKGNASELSVNTSRIVAQARLVRTFPESPNLN
jgi:hypothetical protein